MPGPKAGNITREQARIFAAWSKQPREWLTLTSLTAKLQANRRTLAKFAITLVAARVAEINVGTFPVTYRMRRRSDCTPEFGAKLESALEAFNQKSDKE